MSGPVAPSGSDDIEELHGILSFKQARQSSCSVPHTHRPPFEQPFHRMSGPVQCAILRNLAGLQQSQDLLQPRHVQRISRFPEHRGPRSAVETRWPEYLVQFAGDIDRLGLGNNHIVAQIDRQDMGRITRRQTPTTTPIRIPFGRQSQRHRQPSRSPGGPSGRQQLGTQRLQSNRQFAHPPIEPPETKDRNASPDPTGHPDRFMYGVQNNQTDRARARSGQDCSWF